MTTLLLLLTLSLAGSLMALLLFFCKPLLHRRISRRVWYYLWIPVLLRFCLPIGGVWPVFGAEAALPSEPGTSISDTTTSVTETTTRPTTLKTQQSSMTTLPTDTMSTEATTAPTTKSETTTDAAALLPPVGEDPPTGGATGWSFTFQPWMGGALWGAGAVLFLFSQLIAYWRLQGLLRRHSQPAGEAIQATLAALNGSHPLPQIRVCTAVSSPMLTGLVCPCIVLPQESYPPVELQNILLHELSHLHRGDLFYKWSALLVHTLHWFNPLLWLVRRELDTACEEACDESVIVSMSEQARKDYGNTLLNMASARRIAAGLVVTTMATPKKKLKERLVSIMTYRKMSARTIAFVLVFALVLCLSGCLIDSSVPPENIPGNDPVSEIDPTPESSENVSESDNPESSSMDADTSLDITVDTAVFTTKFSEKEMRAALDAYTRLLGAKAVSDRKLLLCAGFSEPQLKSVYLESRGSSFIKISRADFVRQMQTYVTEEWLENDLLFSCIKEEETWYFFDSDGMAVEGNTYTIDSITPAGEKTYLARISNKELYPIIDFTVRFAVAEQNGKCVIAYWQVTENHSGTKVDEIQRGDAATFTTKFSIEEVTAAKTVYDRLVGASQPRRMLIQMGFPFESDRNMEYDPDTNYQLTDVDYADYKAKALAYVSEEWFERHRYFSGNCKNEDGKLSFLEGGGSGYSRIIQQVIPTDHNTYLVREIGNEWAPGNVSTVEFAVAEHNGKCVIAYVGSNIDYQELPYPTEPTESYPVNADTFTNERFSAEGVKAALDWYHKAKGVSMCDDLFPLLGLSYSAIETYEDGMTRSNGSYDRFLNAVYDHISKEWYNLKFASYFREENGRLVYRNGGRSGITRTVLDVTRTDWNTYIATYYLADPGYEDFGPTCQAEFAVTEQDGQCVIAYYQELSYVRGQPLIQFDNSSDGMTDGSHIKDSANALRQFVESYFQDHPECAFLLTGYTENGEPYLSDMGVRLSMDKATQAQIQVVSEAFHEAGKVFDVIRHDEKRVSFHAETEAYAIVYTQDDVAPTFIVNSSETGEFLTYKISDHWYEIGTE